MTPEQPRVTQQSRYPWHLRSVGTTPPLDAVDLRWAVIHENPVPFHHQAYESLSTMAATENPPQEDTRYQVPHGCLSSVPPGVLTNEIRPNLREVGRMLGLANTRIRAQHRLLLDMQADMRHMQHEHTEALRILTSQVQALQETQWRSTDWSNWRYASD